MLFKRPMARTTLLFVGLLLVWVVVQLPARVVTPLLPPTVSLEGVSGSIWDGSAARAQLRIQGKAFMLGRVQWQLSPLSLLLLTPQVDVAAQWGSQRLSGSVAVSPRGTVEARDLSINLDVRFSRHLLPLYVGGQVSADIRHMLWNGESLESVDARIVWQNAVWTARAGDVALGNYALVLEGAEASTRGRVETLSGPLQVMGGIALEGRGYSVDLQLAGPATNNEGLRRSLALLAEPSADGFKMSLQGEL